MPRVGRKGSSLVSYTPFPLGPLILQLSRLGEELLHLVRRVLEHAAMALRLAAAVAQRDLDGLAAAQGNREPQGQLARRLEAPGRERRIEGEGEHLGDAAEVPRHPGARQDAAMEEVVLREAQLQAVAGVEGAEQLARAADEEPAAHHASDRGAAVLAAEGLVLEVERALEGEGADPLIEEEPARRLHRDHQLIGAPPAPLAQGETGVEHEGQAVNAVDGQPQLLLGVRLAGPQQAFPP